MHQRTTLPVMVVMLLALGTLACGMRGTAEPTGDVVEAAAECDDQDVTGTPTGLPPITIRPSHNVGPRCYSVLAKTDLTISWNDLPGGYSYVEYYLSGNPFTVGDDPSNGFAITMGFGPDAEPTILTAVAIDRSGSNPPLTSDPVIIFIED